MAFRIKNLHIDGTISTKSEISKERFVFQFTHKVQKQGFRARISIKSSFENAYDAGINIALSI